MLGLLTKIWRRPISLRLSDLCQLGFSWCRWAVSWVRPPVQWNYSTSVEVFTFSRMQEKYSPPVDIFNFSRRQEKYLPSVSGCRRGIFEKIFFVGDSSSFFIEIWSDLAVMMDFVWWPLCLSLSVTENWSTTVLF